MIRRLRDALRARPDLVAGAGLAVLVVLLFSDLVFRGRVLFERDIHLFWYTQVESFVRIVATPAWPLWDPYTSFGQPLLADPSSQILYPPTWLHLLMRPWVYLTPFVLIHLWGSGFGLMRLAQALRVSRAGSFVTAALWVASGPLVSLVNNVPHFTGACWIPWVLLAAERAASRPSPKRAAVWALAASAQVLAGSADMCAFALLGTLTLLSLHVDWRRWRANGPMVGAALLAGLLTAMITAALWAPALEVALRSARRDLGSYAQTYWSVHPASLLELVLPIRAHRLPLTSELRWLLSEGREPFLGSLYLGLPTLALLAAVPCSRQRRLPLALLALLLLAAVLALGRHTPVHGWLLSAFPPARIFRYPQKLMVLVAVAVALLAGIGFDAWRIEGERGRRWWLSVAPSAWLAVALGWLAVAATTCGAHALGARLLASNIRPDQYGAAFTPLAERLALAASLATLVALLVHLRRPRRPGRVAAAVAVLSVASLVAQHRNIEPTTVSAFFRFRPPVLDHIPREDHARLYVFDYLSVKQRSRYYLDREEPYVAPPGLASLSDRRWLAYRSMLSPPVTGTWGREGSYEVDYRGLAPRALESLRRLLFRVEESPARHLRMLQLAAVRYVVALHTRTFANLEPVAQIRSRFLPDPIRVFRVPDPLPRCYVVDGARPAQGERALALLVDPTFDPTHEVVLASRYVRPRPGFRGTCRIADFRPDNVRLSVDATAPAFVVLVDAYDPGWRASVDGQPADVLPANVAFRAVPVPAGTHDVRLRYRPRGLLVGLPLSCLALAFALWLAARRRGGTAPDRQDTAPASPADASRGETGY